MSLVADRDLDRAEAHRADVLGAKVDVRDADGRDENLAALVVDQREEPAAGDRFGERLLDLFGGALRLDRDLAVHVRNPDLDLHSCPPRRAAGVPSPVARLPHERPPTRLCSPRAEGPRRTEAGRRSLVWQSGNRGRHASRPTRRTAVEIKVGITHVNREVAVESESTPEEIQAALTEAIASGGFLTLVDDKGRKVLIPASGIAYVDLGAEHVRAVGFGAI